VVILVSFLLGNLWLIVRLRSDFTFSDGVLSGTGVDAELE